MPQLLNIKSNNSNKIKLCFIANLNSIHSQKWIRYFCLRGYDVTVISTFIYEGKFESAKVINLNERNNEKLNIKDKQPLSRNYKNILRNILLRLSGKNMKFIISLRYYLEMIRRLLKSYSYAADVKNILKEVNPDLVHCLRINFEGYIGYLSNNGYPLVITVWGDDFMYSAKLSLIHHDLTKKVMNITDLLFTDCKRDREFAIKYGYNGSRPCVILPGAGGIEFNEIPDRTHDYQQIWSKYKLSLEKPILISFRGFGFFYRNDLIIEAIAIVKKSIGDIQLILVGNKASLEFQQLSALVKKLDLIENTTFLNTVSNNDIKDLVKISNLVLSITKCDGTPNSLLETMAFGGIPVVNRHISISEWITDSWNGYIVQKNTSDDVAKTIMKALSEQDQHKLFRIRNLEIVRQRADYLNNMKLVENNYLNLLNGANVTK